MKIKVCSYRTRSTFASGLSNGTGLAFNSAGILFVADAGSGNIYEYTPGGTRSTFVSGLSGLNALAFNSVGDLFVSDSNAILEFTQGGVESTFATGLNNPQGLAFNSAGNLFVADFGSDNIYEYTPDGTRSTFATGLQGSPCACLFEPSFACTGTVVTRFCGDRNGRSVAPDTLKQINLKLVIAPIPGNGNVRRTDARNGNISGRDAMYCPEWGEKCFLIREEAHAHREWSRRARVCKLSGL